MVPKWFLGSGKNSRPRGISRQGFRFTKRFSIGRNGILEAILPYRQGMSSDLFNDKRLGGLREELRVCVGG